MPSETLVEHCAARRPTGCIDLEVKLIRKGTGGDFTTENRAHLIAGSIHDDALLADESLIMEQFPSPLILYLTTQSSASGQVRL